MDAKGYNKIGYTLVLKTKLNADASLQRKKARLVARRFAQRPNIDFNKAFAPVAELNPIHLLVGLACQFVQIQKIESYGSKKNYIRICILLRKRTGNSVYHTVVLILKCTL